MSVTFLIVNPWQSRVYFIRSGVIRCTLLVVHYLDRMCQCGLHAVLWSHICILMHRLAAEPCSTAGLLFPSRCPSGTILLTPHSMVWEWQISRAGQCFFIGLSCSIPTIVFYSFSLSLLSVYRLVLWGWGLRTDRVYINLSLSAVHCGPFLIIIIIMTISLKPIGHCNVIYCIMFLNTVELNK